MFDKNNLRVVFSLFVLLSGAFVPGCSEDECPTAPEKVVPRGSNISVEFLHPQPAPGDYGGLWVAGSNDVWVCGGTGLVQRRQGSAWTHYDTPTRNNLNGIWGSSTYDVFAVGEQGTIIHFNGAVWTQMNTNVLLSLNGVWGSASDDVYAIGYRGNIVHYDGSGWDKVDHGLTSGAEEWYLYDIWGTGPDDVFVVGYVRDGSSDGLVWHYDGSSWSETRIGSRLYAVSGTGSDNVFAAGTYGQLYRYNGSSWLTQSSLGTNDIYAIWCASVSDMWAAGYKYDYGISRYVGALWRFNGISWVEQGGSMFLDRLDALDGSASNDVYLAGEGNQLARFDGSSWEFVSDLRVTGNDLSGIWGFSSWDVWASGEYETTVHFDGSAWSAVENAGSEHLGALWGSAPDNLYAVGGEGRILRYDGFTWSEVVHGLTTESLGSIWGTSASDIWVGGSEGTLLRFNGSVWYDVGVDDITHGWVGDIWGASPNDYYFVVESAILHYDGYNWEILNIPDHYVGSVHGVSTDQVYFTATAVLGMPMAGGKTSPPDAAQPSGTSTVFRYTGSEFVKLNIQTDAWLGDIWAFAANNIFIVAGPFATIAHYNGSVLTEVTVDERGWFSQLWGTGGDTVYSAGSMGSVIRATLR